MDFSFQYIDVAVALPIHNTFTYRVSETLLPFVAIGKRVLVPFGKRKVTGYILGPCKNDKKATVKYILDILDETSLFPESLLPFFKWTSRYYMYPLGITIKNALPGGLNISDYSTFVLTDSGKKALLKKSLDPKESQILEPLISGSLCHKDLRKVFNKKIPGALIDTLIDKGWIHKTRRMKPGRTKPKLETFIGLTQKEISRNSLSPKQNQLMDVIKSNKTISLKKLRKLVPYTSRYIKQLEKKGCITLRSRELYRDPFGEPIEKDTRHTLTDDQRKAVHRAKENLGKGFKAYLLAGVTGSGKTEVYMRLAKLALNANYSVLVLVPEIALISQMERRFRARFGDGIALLHSGLSKGERYDQWLRIIRQESKIVIGARSAIFAPLKNLGVIIVDEEHDSSYKQEGHLHYNARDLSLVRAKLNNCIAILGSATPSIQSSYNVHIKKFDEIRLKKRIEDRPLPAIRVVDLRNSRDIKGVKRFITPELHSAMIETLGNNKQILLFLNRRGFANFPVCAACGESVRCKNCDITLTLHRQINALKCHYCGFTKASMSKCSNCGSSKIKLLGLGTEKVEEGVKALFPTATVARMDGDTTVRKGAIVKLLKGLKNNTTDILIGTQMIAKGHDFPNITLVGIICADLSLSFPDFRAGEKTFQLLAQVAGRAGRGLSAGKVVLQTYNPDHFSILAAKDQDYKSFYNKEIEFRKTINYPPFSRMIQLKISGRDKGKTKHHALAIGDLSHAIKKKHALLFKTVEILGPIEASISRIANRYRWQILFKGINTASLHRLVHELIFKNEKLTKKANLKVIVDVDPFFMM